MTAFLLSDGSLRIGRLRVLNPSKELKVRHLTKTLPDDVITSIKSFVMKDKLKEELDRKVKMRHLCDPCYDLDRNPDIQTPRLEKLIQMVCPVVIRSTKKLFILEERGKKARHFHKENLYPDYNLREYNQYNFAMCGILCDYYNGQIHHPKFALTPYPPYYRGWLSYNPIYDD